MSFKDIWTTIREKFPPARAVAFLTPILLPIIAYVNTFIADHAPWVDQYVGQDQRMGIFVGTIVAGVALAYKWLDGRSHWETKQVEAYVALAQSDKLGDIPPGVLERPAEVVTASAQLDDDAVLSEPDDIAESDADDPDLDERVEREQLERRQ